MKVRLDFVSNSSSSSYLVAVNKEDEDKPIECEIVIREQFNLEDLVEDKIKSIKDLQKYFESEHLLEGMTFDNVEDWDWKWGQETYVNAKKAIEEGKTILVCWTDSDSSNNLSCHVYRKGLRGIDFTGTPIIKLVTEDDTNED